MKKLVKIISIIIGVAVLLLYTSCSEKDESNVSTPSVQNTKSQEIDVIPEFTTPADYANSRATHFVIASCIGVEIKDEIITFAFYPIVVYMGDFGEKMFTEITEHYYAEGFYVQGNVEEYSLNDVYARGNSYLLWLNERKIINGTAYYNDLKPYGTEAVRVLEEHDCRSFEGIEQVLEHLYAPSQANTGLLRFVEQFMENKQKENSFQTPSANE